MYIKSVALIKNENFSIFTSCASVSLHTFSFMALCKFVFNFNLGVHPIQLPIPTKYLSCNNDMQCKITLNLGALF